MYNKQINELKSYGEVKVTDSQRNIEIFSDEIVYKKNNEIISTNKNSKAIYDNKVITAEKFEYQINQNVLLAFGEVKVTDSQRNIEIFSDEIVYKKNNEIISTNKNSKAIYDNKVITAEKFEYQINQNVLLAFGEVKVTDSQRNIEIFSDEIVYKKNNEIISTNKNSKAIYDNKVITAEKFEYQINQNVLGAKKESNFRG